jgi:hypothetical protein
VDDQSIEEFEADLKNNLYKLWNRMSSGSYFPPPVKRVQIDKRDGGKRPLGIPTVIANCTIGQLTFGMGRDPASIPSALGAAVSRTQDTTRSRR